MAVTPFQAEASVELPIAGQRVSSWKGPEILGQEIPGFKLHPLGKSGQTYVPSPLVPVRKVHFLR